MEVSANWELTFFYHNVDSGSKSGIIPAITVFCTVDFHGDPGPDFDGDMHSHFKILGEAKAHRREAGAKR